MISINDVLSVASGTGAPFEGVARVVGVNADQSTVALVRLDLRALQAPFIRPVANVTEALSRGEIVRLEVFDTGLAASRSQLRSAAEAHLNKALELMLPLLGDDRLLFDPEYRGREFRKRAAECKVSERWIRRHYYEYLSGGMTELALAGRQRKKGLVPVPQKEGTARRGRRPSSEGDASRPLPEIRKQLEDGARTYFLPGEHTVFEAYNLTLMRYFSKGKQVKYESGVGRTLEELLVPPARRPSLHQFRYMCQLLERKEGKRKRQPGRIRPQKPKMLLKGRVRDEVAGPGYRFEIDATKLQVQLVSRYGRQHLVGEATLYIVIDVWSGAIVGYAVSLNNPSWALASKALGNCFTDKARVFDRLRLPYTSNHWPCRHLPLRLAADRGELVSNKAGVVPELGITVEIMPSMRPERKGKVEASFRDIKHRNTFYHLSGQHPKNPRRREPDGKNTAALTLEELEICIVQIILDLNNDPVPFHYVPADALTGGCNPITHIGLFNWGLEHRPGLTRSLDPKAVFNALLTRAHASMTSRGIRFRKEYFLSPKLHDLGFTARATNSGAFEIEIRYDDHFADQVWFYDEISRDWIPALNDNEETRRLKTSFFELEKLHTEHERLALEAKAENVHRRAQRAVRINAMTKRAAQEASQRGVFSKPSKANIRKNKRVDQTAENLVQSQRALESFVTPSKRGSQQQENGINPSSSHSGPDAEHSPDFILLDLWRKARG